MSDWKDALKQIKDNLTQQPEKKTASKPSTAAASVKQPSDAKTSTPLNDGELFIETMSLDGVKPIPEFIAMKPEYGTVKKIALKLKDLTASQSEHRGSKHYLPRLQTKNIRSDSAPARKTVSSDLPSEITGGKNRVTIGIDFGTSTTKVCARLELGENDVPIYLLDISDNSDTLEGLTPSLVSMREGLLYFGDHAHKGITIPHVKVCLACEEKRFSTKECLWAEACPISAFGAGLSASDLATLYLSWVMKESRKRLPDPLKKADSFVFNIGIPLKQLDDSHLKAVFDQITYFAWRLSNGVTQGLNIAQAKVWLDILKKQSAIIPPPEDRMIQLCPETSAAIVSFVNSTKALPGLYCLCDIGAWTSDISVFRLTDVAKDETGVDRLSFYASGVTRKACEEIDLRIVNCLTDLWGLDSIKDFIDDDIMREIRSVREGQHASATFTVSTENGQRELALPPIARDYASNVVAEAVGRYFVKIIKHAYQKEREADKWRNVSLVMTGGGSRDNIFEEIFSENCGCQFNKVLLNMYTINNVSKEQHFRFAVAAGLSHPLAIWPEQLLPSEVSAWRPQDPKRIADRDEQYAK